MHSEVVRRLLETPISSLKQIVGLILLGVTLQVNFSVFQWHELLLDQVWHVALA